MDNEKDTIDKLFTKKISNLNKNENHCFDKYKNKITEINLKLIELEETETEDKIEVENKKIDNQIKRETNKVKLDELKAKKANLSSSVPLLIVSSA